MKKFFSLVLVIIFSMFIMVPVGFAQTPADVQMLQSRVLELERALAEVRGLLDQQKTEVSEFTEQQATVCSKYDMCIYGFARLDVCYDTDRTNDGDTVATVNRAVAGGIDDDDNEMQITARHSRLGLLIDGPNCGDAETNVRFELDFYGGGNEDAAEMRMRHAYFELKYPNWKILAGQTTDVLSPLYSPIFNIGSMSSQGNLNGRIPQLRLTNYFDFLGGKITTDLAACRNLAGDSDGNANVDDDGEDSGIAEGQACIEWKGKLFANERDTKIQTSFVLGQEEVDWLNSGAGKDGSEYNIYGACLGIVIPLFQRFTFMAEIWDGQNLDSHNGGIGQGVENNAAATRREIVARGGWASLSFNFNDKLTFNTGYGVDAPQTRDLDGTVAGNPIKNEVIFSNFLYKLSSNVTWGIEYMRMQTKYNSNTSADDGENDRLQGMMMYSF